MNKGSKTAQKIFKKFFNNKPNPMSNYQYSFGSFRRNKTSFVYEISYGSGLFVDYIVGVTILKVEPGNKISRADLNKSFPGNELYNLLEEAERYITSLEEEQ